MMDCFYPAAAAQLGSYTFKQEMCIRDRCRGDLEGHRNVLPDDRRGLHQQVVIGSRDGFHRRSDGGEQGGGRLACG